MCLRVNNSQAVQFEDTSQQLGRFVLNGHFIFLGIELLAASPTPKKPRLQEYGVVSNSDKIWLLLFSLKTKFTVKTAASRAIATLLNC